MPRSSVTDTDKGWKAIVESLGGRGFIANVGVQADGQPRQDGAGPTNVDLAVTHEFGTEKIPERSFLRSSFDEHKPEYAGMLEAGSRQIYDRKRSVEEVVGIIGEKCSSDIKQRINDGIPPPNSPLTIARKGSSTPLIDTAQMKNSITSKVVREGDEPLADVPGGSDAA